MLKYPRSRQDNLVLQELDNEVIIYDLSDNRAFCLNETSALVWQLCNGERNITEITQLAGQKIKTEVNEDLVWLAIEQLKKEKLVSAEVEMPQHFIGKSRREVIKKIGLGTMIALPVVASLIAPTAVEAAACSGPSNLGFNAPCNNSCDCADQFNLVILMNVMCCRATGGAFSMMCSAGAVGGCITP